MSKLTIASNLVDWVSDPIDTAKELITSQYFTDTPCDAALLAFHDQFIVTISGTRATVHHPLANKTITISVAFTTH